MVQKDKFTGIRCRCSYAWVKDNYEVKDVMARLNTLVSVEAKLKETEKSLTDAQTVIAGKDATIPIYRRPHHRHGIAFGLPAKRAAEKSEKRVCYRGGYRSR